jgi:hypothetical protein
MLDYYRLVTKKCAISHGRLFKDGNAARKEMRRRSSRNITCSNSCALLERLSVGLSNPLVTLGYPELVLDSLLIVVDPFFGLVRHCEQCSQLRERMDAAQ